MLCVSANLCRAAAGVRSLPSSPDSPSNGGGIATGPDGALWFTQGWGPLWMTEVDPHAGLIGRFSPSSARVPESRKVSAATFPCPVVTPIPTAPSTPSPSGSRLCVLRLLPGSTPHASFIHQDDRALMQDRFQFWNDISTAQQ